MTSRKLKADIHNRESLYAGFLRVCRYEIDVEAHAGGIAADETVFEAAKREMREETGLVLSNPVLIHPGAYPSSGGTSERICIVYGTVDTSRAGGVHGNALENEDILTVVLPARVFIEQVRRGAINDLKTLVAGYWFAERHADRAFRLTTVPD